MKETNQQTKLIDFEGEQLLGIKTESGVYLAIRKSCLDIGLNDKQADRQMAKIQEDLVLKSNTLKFEVVQNEGGRQIKREVLGIHEDVVTLWLAKISLTPNMKKDNPITVEKLVNYQLKAAKVLHEAFMATEEQTQEFYEDIGLKGEIVELKQEVQGMKSTMNTLIDASTINRRQAKKLNEAVRERISTILGGAHSPLYKKDSRMYFKNLWLGLCDKFEVNSYLDLCPLDFNNAFTYVSNWSMM